MRGLWPGSTTLAADARDGLDLLAARHPETPLYLLGESMGAAVALTALAEGEPHAPLAGLILSAPALQGWQTLSWFAQSALWLSAYSVPWWSATGRGLDIQVSDNIEMLRALARDPLVIRETRIDALYGLVGLMDEALDAAPAIGIPTLLLFGANDELIEPDAIARLDTSLAAPHRTARPRAAARRARSLARPGTPSRCAWRSGCTPPRLGACAAAGPRARTRSGARPASGSARS